MRIILVRHGETEDNAAGIIQGQLPGRLSQRGRKQVELLGARLAVERLDAIYSSDLERARQTTLAIARHHPGVPVTWTEELRERFLGRYQGRKGSDVDRVELASAPDVETEEQMLARARRLLDRLRRLHARETVLLSGHGAINRAIFAVLSGSTIEETRAMAVMDNAGICVFEGADGRMAALALNDTAHLARQGGV